MDQSLYAHIAIHGDDSVRVPDMASTDINGLYYTPSASRNICMKVETFLKVQYSATSANRIIPGFRMLQTAPLSIIA